MFGDDRLARAGRRRDEDVSPGVERGDRVELKAVQLEIVVEGVGQTSSSVDAAAISAFRLRLNSRRPITMLSS